MSRPVISQVNAGADKSVCTNTTTLNAIPAGGVWSTSGSSIIVSISSQSTTVNNLASGANSFTYSVAGVGNDVIIVTNNQVIANAGSDITNSCSSSATLSGNVIPAGGSGQWSLLFETPGVSITNTATNITTTNNLPFGNTIFVWTISANGCAASDEVSINNSIPINNIGTNKSACTNIFYIGAETPPTGGSGNWSTVSSPGTIVFSSSDNPGSEIIAPSGSSTVRWTINFNTCNSGKDFVITNNLPVLNAGTDIQTCIDTISLNASTLQAGEQGVWSVIDPQAEIFTNASIYNPIVSGVKQGTTTFEWTVSNANCTASDLVLVVNNRPDIYAGPDDVICINNHTFSANNPISNIGIWTCTDPTVVFNDANLYNATASILENNIYTFTWTVSNGVCIASDDVLITSDYVSISAGLDESSCSNIFSLSGTPVPPGGSGYWSLTFGDGTIDNSLSANTTVRNISDMSHFKWTIISGACTYYDEVQLVNQLPSQAVTQADKAVCSNQTLITATPPVNQNEAGIWSVEGAGGAVIQNSSLFQTLVSSLDPGSNTFKWTIYNQYCSTSDLIEVTNNQITTNAGVDATICTTSYTLNATNTGGTGYWTSSNASIVFANSTSPATSVSNLSFGDNTFTWTRNDLGCIATDDVVITSDLPVNISAGIDQTVCQDAANLSANSPAYGSGSWSIVSGGGVFASETSYQTGVSNIALGQNIYRWTVSYNGCSSSDDVEILNKRIVVTAGIDQTICNLLITNLSATAPSIGQSGTWSVIGGIGVFIDQTLYDTNVSGMIKGINTYRWTLSDMYCTNSAELTITNNTPDSAKVGANQIICTGNTAISAVAVSNGTGSWSVSSGQGIFEQSDNNNTQISLIGFGTNTYTWTVTKNSCSLSADHTVTNNSVNAEITDTQIEICEANHSTTIAAVGPIEPGASGYWTKLSAGSGIIESPSNYQTVISSLANGDNRFRWTVQNADCSSYDEITVVNNYYTASAASVGSSAVCNNYIAIIGNAPPPSGTGNWTANSTQVTFDNSLSSNTYARNLPLGTTNLTWVISNAGCSASANFDIINNSLTVSAGNDIAGCEASQVLNADALAGGQTGYWIANNASVIFANSNEPTTTASNIPAGTSQLTWTITANGCFASDDIILSNNSFIVTAGSNQTICGSNQTIYGSDPLATGTGSWSVIQGTGVVFSPTSPTTNVSNLSNGENRFRWTVTRNSCVAIDEVVIINDLYVAQASAPLAVCIDEVAVTAQTLPAGSGATGIWETLFGGGIFDNVNDYVTTARGLSLGSNRFRWTVTKGLCVSYVNVDVMDNRVVVSAGADQTTCGNFSSLLATPLSATGTGLWTSNIGTVNIMSPTEPITTVTNLSRGANIFTWTVTDKNCIGSNSITITNNAFDANAGIDQEITVSNTSMTAELPLGATGTWLILNGNASFSNYSDPLATISNTGYGINNYRWTVNSNGCSAYDDVVIIYNVAEANAGIDQLSCLDYATLSAEQPLMGTGSWSLVQGTGTFQDTAKYNTLVTNVSRGANIYRWTVTAFGVSAADDVAVTNNSFDISTGEDQQTCNTTVNLKAESAGTGVGFWYIFQGNGSFSNNYDSVSSVTNMMVGTNLYIWQVDRNDCTATDTIEIVHYQPVTEANAGEDVQICDENEYLLAANQPVYGTGNWSSANTSFSFDNPLQFSTMARNLPNGSVTLWWTISNQYCQSQDDVVISSWNSIDIVDQPTSKELNEGGSVLFEVETTGNVTTFQWQKDGVNLSNGGRIYGADSDSLNITNLTTDDIGEYQCIVTGYCNNRESYIASLSVISGFEDLSENGIKIYPNPSSGVINLDFEDASKISDLSIYHLSGKKVFERQKLDKKEKVDLSNHSEGSYIIVIQSGHKQLKSKFIIQK